MSDHPIDDATRIVNELFDQVGPPPADPTVAAIRSYERDPSTASWRNAVGQSTSARLAQEQRNFAASQQDLTKALAERDEAVRKLNLPCGSCHPCDAYGAQQDRDTARAEAKANAADADRYLAELQQTAVELMRAKAEVRRLEAELGAALGRLNEQTHGEPS